MMDDLISRQAAIKVCFNGWNKNYREIAQDIKDLPPAPTPNAPKTLDTDTQHVQDVECVGDDTVCMQPETTTEIQEILDYLDNELHPLVSPDNWNVYSELYDMVSELKTVPPSSSRLQESQWIPCSERLPETEEQVLIYAWNVHYVLAKYKEIRTCDGVYKMAWVTEDAYNIPREIKHEVICWMPLPEPYKGEQG